MRGATDDPAVAALLATHKKLEIGRVIKAENGASQLWDETTLLFEARRIGARSRADNGTVALDAVTGDQTPIEDAEVTGTGDEIKLVSSPREIWIVGPTGSKTKVSPANVDAFEPVIDPKGQSVAFTGRLLSDKGLPSSPRLYVVDIASGRYRVFGNEEPLHSYQVWAFDWVQNSSVLRVLQDHGETGGHMKLKQVRIQQ